MQFLERFYLKTLKYNLINKFYYENSTKLPKIEKVVLTFNSKFAIDLQTLIKYILMLQLVTNQRSIITKARQPNISLRIKKGDPAGCKVTLRKQSLISFFLKILIEILPTLKVLSISIEQNLFSDKTYSCALKNTFAFKDLQEHYRFFSNLPILNVTILLKNKSKAKELQFILHALKFPKQ